MAGGSTALKQDVARQGFRQVTTWLHGWSGLVLGWLLFAMCLSGSLAVFKPEIGRWMRPEISGPADPVRAVTAAVAYLETHAKGAHGWFMNAPTARSNVTEAVWEDASVPGGFRTEALHPVTGRPDGARHTLGGEFFYRLHFELQLPYPYGRILASIAAMFLLVTIVSGVIAHRRIFADMFLFRRGKGQRSWLDAHNLFGTVALPFHLMITYSGLVTLTTVSMPWAIVSAYGADIDRAGHEFAPGFVERPQTHRAAPVAPVAPMLMEALRRFGPGAHIGQVNFEHPGDTSATVSITRFDGDQLAKLPVVLAFDGVTGQLISDRTEQRPAVKSYDTIYGLHMGRFGFNALRWLYFLCGLLLTATVATGLILWTVKRRDRPGAGRANEFVARLNIGVIAGTPTAFMAMFWANRLLPETLAGRQAMEIAAVFWTWGAVLVLAFLLPSRRGWLPLLTLAALACAGPPVLSLFDGIAAAPGDRTIVVGNFVMLVAALGFGAGALRVGRRGRSAFAKVATA